MKQPLWGKSYLCEVGVVRLYEFFLAFVVSYTKFWLLVKLKGSSNWIIYWKKEEKNNNRMPIISLNEKEEEKTIKGFPLKGPFGL